jgi:hypothetical protein
LSTSREGACRQPHPTKTNELFEAAINSGDIDAALAPYEPGACLVATPGEPEHSSVLQVGELLLTANA